MSLKIVELNEIVTELPCNYGEEQDVHEFIGNVVKVSNVDSGGILYNEFEKRSFRKKDYEKLVCQKNDLLVVKSSGSKTNILSGKTAIVKDETDLIASNFLMRLRVDLNVADPIYLWYFLNSKLAKKYIVSIVGATTYPNLKWDLYSKMPIPLPPLTTQKRIAEILDAADALRRKDLELLKKYDELAQAIFIDMFGDPVKNEKGWDVKSLDDFGYWKSGGTPSRTKRTFFEGEIPWISSGELNDVFISNSIEHITEEAIHNSSTSLIEEGSLLLGMYDTAALKSSINKVELCCNQAIAFSKLNEKICNTLYIYFFIQLNKDELKKGQRGVRQKNLNLTMVKELKILNPPKEMQDTFAKIFKKVLELKVIIDNNKISNFLFDSLIQKAFKGELVA
jgi:type I restriction enzyme S subunit